MTKLDEIEVQLASSSGLAEDSPALAERHSYLSAAISEASAPALREGSALLERVGRDEPGAQGVSALVSRFHDLFKIYVFMKRHSAVASETLTITDYRGHRQTVLSVREINLKACTPIISRNNLFSRVWGLNPGPVGNRFRLNAHLHYANEPQRQALSARLLSLSLSLFITNLQKEKMHTNKHM